METEINEQPAIQVGLSNGAQTNALPLESKVSPAAHSHVSPAACANCGTVPGANGNGMASPSYVFAIGRVEMRFPTLAVEKEFAQATGRTDTKGLTDRKTIHTVLSDRANRYILRQANYLTGSCCWRITQAPPMSIARLIISPCAIPPSTTQPSMPSSAICR